MITKILQKHQGYRDSWYLGIDNPYKIPELKNASSDLENNLKIKWKEHIPKGWYGFSIGRPCPDAWFNIIDEFLGYLKSIDSSFEIHQIKLKFGGLRFYISFKTNNEETEEFINLQIEKLEYNLYDKKLIW